MQENFSSYRFTIVYCNSTIIVSLRDGRSQPFRWILPATTHSRWQCKTFDRCDRMSSNRENNRPCSSSACSRSSQSRSQRAMILRITSVFTACLTANHNNASILRCLTANHNINASILRCLTANHNNASILRSLHWDDVNYRDVAF